MCNRDSSCNVHKIISVFHEATALFLTDMNDVWQKNNEAR